MIITIDGPAASGKSTIARMTAESLHFYYLNTGSLYRAVTYLLMEIKEYTEKDLQDVKQEDLDDCIDTQRLHYAYNAEQGPIVLYDQQDITNYLKDPVIDRCVSLISPQKKVREALSDLQRSIAQEHDVVVEGRDVGSVVFPHADYKFYLTAAIQVRADRWQKYQQKKGNNCTLEDAMQRLEARDTQDKTREISPLVIPANAIQIDNSQMTLQQTVEEILKYIKN